MTCKKVLDILFKVDKMEDYMDYSSASEDDLDYDDCEDENDSSTATDHSQEKKGPAEEFSDGILKVNQ